MTSNSFINQNGEEQSLRLGAVDRLSLSDEIRAIEKRKSQSAWYNPATGNEVDEQGRHVLPETIYLGESKLLPTWEEPVFDVGKFREARAAHKAALKSGSISSFDWGKYEDPWIGEWSGINQEAIYRRKQNGGRLKQAAVGTNSDFSAIDVVNVLAEIVNTELRNFALENAVTNIGTPQLNLNIDTWTRFTNSVGVPEGVAPQTKRPNITRAAFNLTKDVVHVAFTDESQLRASHDILRQAIENASTDMKRIRSNKIATELETATAVSIAATWAAMTTGDHNDRIPQNDIGTAADTIFANNGGANIATMHDKVFRYFLTNSYVKGILQGASVPDLSLAKVITNVPALPGFTFVIDNEHTNTLACVLDKGAVFLMDGPKRAANYRLEQEGIDGYLVRDWNLTKIIIGGRIRKLTGVA